jgi:tripartite-type tricarboxylate transporter receptor subunit TctC
MRRREFLALAGAAVAAPFFPKASAQVQNWPDKPVKLILPYAPGGGTDLIGRPWAEKLGQSFHQQFIIENRGGAGGMIGTEAASKAAPDGYTFLLTPNATLSVLPNLRKTPYDPKSFLAVARVGDFVTGFSLHPAVGPKTFQEMIAYAKANPGKLSYGSAGLGTATHLRIEMLKYRAGIDILHVPYRGQRRRAERSPAQHRADDERDQHHSPRQGGQAPAPEHQQPRTSPRFPRRADAERMWLSQFGCPDLVCSLRPGRHAQGDRRQTQCQDRGTRRQRRNARTHALDQHRGSDANAEEMVAYLEADTARNVELIKATDMKLE